MFNKPRPPIKPVKPKLVQPDQSLEQPIPPPTDSMQYRAIGLVYGTYVPEHREELTRGVIVVADGLAIEAVILGKMITVIKKRLDLSQSHYWVVYPRTRPKQGSLHLQISGVWAPAALGKTNQTEDPGQEDGYFSVRGEVVAQSFDPDLVTVKIVRVAHQKLDPNQAKFKLQLVGTLPGHPIGYFWQINARRVNHSLEITDAQQIGPVRRSPRPLNKQVILKPKTQPTKPPRPVLKSQKISGE
ncbi:MAG: hypothetical protein SFT94_03705 [Pseudanabaenaceae cyanobacterium bins.68]|nr:hypothetical protein [Pseudanabaenaceae cyanobacterium bins.68]